MAAGSGHGGKRGARDRERKGDRGEESERARGGVGERVSDAHEVALLVSRHKVSVERDAAPLERDIVADTRRAREEAPLALTVAGAIDVLHSDDVRLVAAAVLSRAIAHRVPHAQPQPRTRRPRMRRSRLAVCACGWRVREKHSRAWVQVRREGGRMRPRTHLHAAQLAVALGERLGAAQLEDVPDALVQQLDKANKSVLREEAEESAARMLVRALLGGHERQFREHAGALDVRRFAQRLAQ
eukprot:4152111-Prymnesium_polylepis.1